MHPLHLRVMRLAMMVLAMVSFAVASLAGDNFLQQSDTQLAIWRSQAIVQQEIRDASSRPVYIYDGNRTLTTEQHVTPPEVDTHYKPGIIQTRDGSKLWVDVPGR